MQKGSLSEPSGAVGRWDHEFRLRNRWCGSEVVASMSMCIDRRWLCGHLVCPLGVCVRTGSRLEELMLAGTLRLLQPPD